MASWDWPCWYCYSGLPADFKAIHYCPIFLGPNIPAEYPFFVGCHHIFFIYISQSILYIFLKDASIFSQLVVEKMLASEGIKRTELGREEFIKRVWEWKEKYVSNSTYIVPLCDLFYTLNVHHIAFCSY